MKYRCFIAALLLHILIGSIFFIPYKKTDTPQAVYIQAYLVKNHTSSPKLSFLRKRESSPTLPSSRGAKRRSDPDRHYYSLNPNTHKNHTTITHKNNSANNSQATKLAIYLHDQIQQNITDANLQDSMQNQKIQIEFTLTNTGVIEDIQLQQSTGFKIIDQEITDAVANIRSIPARLLLPQTHKFSLIVLIQPS